MRSTVIENFIDNKIRLAISEKKEIDEIVSSLNERAKNAANLENNRFRNYIDEFSRKRIDDIILVMNVAKFNKMPNNKLLNLIRLRDKLIGNKEVEL
jgi:hypothetical protein